MFLMVKKSMRVRMRAKTSHSQGGFHSRSAAALTASSWAGVRVARSMGVVVGVGLSMICLGVVICGVIVSLFVCAVSVYLELRSGVISAGKSLKLEVSIGESKVVLENLKSRCILCKVTM